jgi:hypothetical protein
MINPTELESTYREFIHNLPRWVPDGVIQVDLALLHAFGLLSPADEAIDSPTHPLTHYFHVMETPEKITLYNDQFVAWIVPQLAEGSPATYTLIAVLGPDKPHLELVFATSGVYNSSRFVLRVLECFLEDIQENEELISKILEAS